MYVRELELTNVRQFEHRTFTFQPGFNLILGVNGAGKTTLLRSLLALLRHSQRGRPAAVLNDDDIRLHASELRVSAEIVMNGHNSAIRPTYRRQLGSRAIRRGIQDAPPILWYGSNEATCSSFVSRRIKRISRRTTRPSEPIESWLHAEEVPRMQFQTAEDGFGRSQEIRSFVLRILSMFSPNFTDFAWSFEPYDCSIHLGGGIPEVGRARQDLRTAIMRFLRENKNPLRDIDRPSVRINADGFISDEPRGKQVIPKFLELLDRFGDGRAIVESLDRWTAEIRLTPGIRILAGPRGSFLLSQLSDGEQRLFSLFADIARQLSLRTGRISDFTRTPAIVLIDEIDVHLHPKWQSMIVTALQELFPACQFIATTHSPFAVQGALEHQVQDLDRRIPDNFVDRGIEEISVKALDVKNPEVSPRYRKMLDAAKDYLLTLEKLGGHNPQNRALLLNKLAALKERYAHNPAYQAFLELRTDATLGSAPPDQ